MTLVDELRTAGLTVIAGARGRARGRLVDVDGIDVLISETGRDSDGAPDLDGVVKHRGAAFYIDRRARVWQLARGPLGGQQRARVMIAAYREDSVSAEQADARDALLAVLAAAYGLGGEERSADASDPEDSTDSEREGPDVQH